MADCKHRNICGRDADGNTGEELCILHSKAHDKDKSAFDHALVEHRAKNGDNYAYFVFPGHTNFANDEFSKKASFYHTEFVGDADFTKANFKGRGQFSHGIFAETVKFTGARFEGKVEFTGAKFFKQADFVDAEFLQSVYFGANFLGATHFAATNFADRVHFGNSVFAMNASFMDATFRGESWFDSANFYGEAIFWQAKFEGVADFVWAMFAAEADFTEATFLQKADFSEALFAGKANFSSVQFNAETDFFGTQFKKEADFHFVEFKGITFFAGGPRKRTKGLHMRVVGREGYPPSEWLLKIFSGVDTDFTDVIITPLDALILRDADLTKCQFLGTDLRKAEITAATWPQVGNRRLGVYDEIAPLEKDGKREWHHIERLYRELKQNYEDRRDYERARDFHYGEKEARRKQAKRLSGLWLWLNLYKWVAGYGERWRLPLVWAAIVLLVSSAMCICLALHPDLGGLHPKLGGPMLSYVSTWDCLRSVFYSFRVMTLLKPEDLEAIRWAKLVYTADSLLGPLLLGLFALALRQRLKR